MAAKEDVSGGYNVSLLRKTRLRMSSLSVGGERSSSDAMRTLFLLDLFRPSSRVRESCICCLYVLEQNCLSRQQGRGHEVDCWLARAKEKLATSEVRNASCIDLVKF